MLIKAMNMIRVKGVLILLQQQEAHKQMPLTKCEYLREYQVRISNSHPTLSKEKPRPVHNIITHTYKHWPNSCYVRHNVIDEVYECIDKK